MFASCFNNSSCSRLFRAFSALARFSLGLLLAFASTFDFTTSLLISILMSGVLLFSGLQHGHPCLSSSWCPSSSIVSFSELSNVPNLFLVSMVLPFTPTLYMPSPGGLAMFVGFMLLIAGRALLRLWPIEAHPFVYHADPSADCVQLGSGPTFHGASISWPLAMEWTPLASCELLPH